MGITFVLDGQLTEATPQTRGRKETAARFGGKPTLYFTKQMTGPKYFSGIEIICTCTPRCCSEGHRNAQRRRSSGAPRPKADAVRARIPATRRDLIVTSSPPASLTPRQDFSHTQSRTHPEPNLRPILLRLSTRRDGYQTSLPAHSRALPGCCQDRGDQEPVRSQSSNSRFTSSVA
jgi:hypothetical protein